MQDLNITLIQTSLHWENVVANLAMLEERIWQIGEKTDVIILPEMFSTGFTMNAAPLAEVMNMQTSKWMKQMADQTGALLLGSIIARDEEKFYNRLLWTEPGGLVKTYDKRHLFRMAEEHRVYQPGKTLLIQNWKGWKICPLICYDLRFPVWSRNHWDKSNRESSYDLLVYVANWPQARTVAWETLLRARAIENLCFVAGVNRTGNDGLGISFTGRSAVIGPKGETLSDLQDGEAIKTISLNATELKEFRQKFPAWFDADDFRIDP